jgi:hypothetical protein
MADLSMVFDLLARDRASAEVGRVGDAMEKAGDQSTFLGDKIGGMFTAAAGAAVGAGLAVGASFLGALESQGAPPGRSPDSCTPTTTATPWRA